MAKKKKQKPGAAQVVALIVGKKTRGRNNYYLDPKHKRFNRNVVTDPGDAFPTTQAIGSLTCRDIPEVVRGRKKKKKKRR